MPNVDEMFQGVRDAATVRRVVGDPIESGGVTVVPVAKVRGGAGGGADSAGNGVGGFGFEARPVGAYVIRGGRVTWSPSVDVNRALLAVGALFLFLALRRK